MKLISALEAGREDFVDAVRGVSPDIVGARSSHSGWSVLDVIEHVIALETRYLDWILEGATVEPRRDSNKELRLFTILRSRLAPVETPEVFRPSGRFTALEEALDGFERVRRRSIELVTERGEALYSVGVRHPYFGPVNGVELLQMIDAHARRHADQVREIGESPSMTKKFSSFKRDEPDLPSELDVGRLEAGDFVSVESAMLQDCERSGARIGAFRIEGSALERVQLAGGHFGSAVWKDVRLIGCDLANVRARRMDLLRVVFVDCRLTGLLTDASEWKEVLVRNGDLAYAQFQGGSFRSCEFDGCNWQEADLQGADLTGCVFRSCNLSRADLRGARLQGTDFRSSELEGMVVGVSDLHGAIVSADQALILSRVLGLSIR